MKSHIQRERSYFQLQRNNRNDSSKSLKRKESYSLSKAEKLSEINTDIEKLYKKYTEKKRERLMKERSQQILVNRLKVLRTHQNSSKNKDSLISSERTKLIHVKKNIKLRTKNNTLKRPKKNKNFQINNYKTIYDNKKESAKCSSAKGNSNENSINNSETQNKKTGDLNENLDNNNIEDILKTYKYNIANKNSNNNIYIIINNPNNSTNKKTKTNENNQYDYDNTPKSKIDDIKENDNNKNKDKDKDKLSDMNFDSLQKGKKIILMKSNGRNIEDIINSINNINDSNNKDENKKDEKKDIKNEEVIIENNINNDCNIKDDGNIINNIEKKKVNENSINDNINVKDNDNNNNQKIEFNDDNNKNSIIKDKLENKQNNENQNDNDEKKDNKIIQQDNINDKEGDNNNLNQSNNKIIENNNKENIEDTNNKAPSNIKENFKKISILNDNQMISEDFIRPNFLELYKNEDSISKHKMEITLRNTDNNNISNNEKKQEDNNTINTLNNQNNEIENNKSKDNNSTHNKNNNQTNINIIPINNNNISDKKEIRKKIILAKQKKININKQKNISPINEVNDFVYLNRRKLANIYNNNNNKNTISNTIQVPANEERKISRIINTDDRNKIKKIPFNNLYTPKKIEQTNKVVIKKMQIIHANQSTKNYNILKKNNNFKIKTPNNLSNSLSYSNLTKKNKLSSNLNKNYNTKRNINLEKFKKNYLRKDSYCSTIERKRKALGIQFKPDFENELTIQNDKTNKNIIFGNLNNYKKNQKNLYNNFIKKNKKIQVSKKDDKIINIKGINAPQQGFKFYKNNFDNTNRHIMLKNKTFANFNYDINNNLNLNDLKKRNIKKLNKEKYNHNYPNYTISDNNNNSIRQMTDFNANLVNNTVSK